jgi:hypothetical protein
MKKILSQPLYAVVFWLVVVTVLIYISDLSTDWMVPLCILPLTVLLGIVHVFACFLPRRITVISGIVGAISGGVGFLCLCYVIAASSDPEAGMGYVSSGLMFAMFAGAGFVVTAIILAVSTSE